MKSSRKRLIAIDIMSFPYNEYLDKLTNLATSKTSSYTCVANVHMLVEAYRNKNFADVVNKANLITPDGMPLVYGLKLLYGLKQDRVAGMDLLPDLLKESQKKNLSVFFYGGTEEMLKKTDAFCREKFPLLSIAGLYSPPFRPLFQDEENEIISQINSSGANFVFVALGCPKQEKWMASMKGKINACMIGIGGALPVVIGMQARAPFWIRKISMEWLFRLAQEPNRLFKRYAMTNTLFMYLIMKTKITQSYKTRYSTTLLEE